MTPTIPPATAGHTPDVAGPAAPAPLLAIRDLRVRFPKRYGDVAVLDGVDLSIGAGEAVAVVGESGCGKSLLGLAAAHLLPPTARVSGSVEFRGQDVRRMSRRELRRMRGAGIGFVYQDAMTSLNPGMSVGAQLRQVCRLGSSSTPEDLLSSVGLNQTERIMRAKPYQLSGGQRQRVLIAIALARDPELVIADEPTTALDVTVQRQVMELLQDLRSSRGFALMFVSHDLALVSEVATRTVVMYAGQVAESGPTADILDRPRHPYSAGLLHASVSLEERWPVLAPIPGHVRQPADFPSGCRFRDRCGNAGQQCAERPVLRLDGARGLACFHPVTGDDDVTAATASVEPGAGATAPSAPVSATLTPAVPAWAATSTSASTTDDSSEADTAIFEVKDLVVDFGSGGGSTRALDHVSLTIRPGQAVGLIGESGSGKTTLSRSLLGLIQPASGEVLYHGRDVYAMPRLARFRTLSLNTAMVFQDPRSSLNPRLSVGAVIRDPLTVLGIGNRRERDTRVGDLLADVGLPAQVADRPVRTLSGGQLQRVALARALSVEPSVVVADEPTSALDVSVQAQILNLFQEIRARRRLAMLVVSHDMRVIRFATDYTAVMLNGKIVEQGPTEQVYESPQHEYTKALLSAAPVLRSVPPP
ncbi:ABC transporter ATP-binding protein [Phytoactinopolyspora alkaliphila]|uniref:Nickel import system ATP-binding protein NikD n=1 Tax=Phytoactinopolyspora alkaliphila TaxID=1783498 RepID=A0A6N9YID6_9ACTN|nr:ABC transporter ATP-binding protein [Phytoactinopolyspora alkaliphila]NED94766.1 ABC transporter ATP-binding protein [Phytoactinopolyspora alkaliphila]